MIPMPHINEKHIFLDRPSRVENMSSQYFLSQEQAEKPGRMNREDTQSSKLEFPKVQEAATCSVSRAAPAEIITQKNQGTPTGSQQCAANPSSDEHLRQERLSFYKNYLIKRMQETQYSASGPELFKEIQTKGYRGSIKSVSNFLVTIRRNQPPPKRYVAHYQDYLIKRMEETGYRLSGTALFKEIQVQGYQGSASTVQNFLSAIRRSDQPPEARLIFHQNYLKEKIQGENQTRRFSTLELFKDVQARGYRGSIGSLKRKVTMLRKETALKKTQAEGYRGSIEIVQNFLAAIERSKLSPETYLSFYKSDLIRKIKETSSNHITAAALFRDIQAKRYRGSIRSLQQFVAANRKNNRLPESKRVSVQGETSKKVKNSHNAL